MIVVVVVVVAVVVVVVLPKVFFVFVFLLTLLLTLCGLTSQKTNQGGLGLSGSVHEEAHPCFPNSV